LAKIIRNNVKHLTIVFLGTFLAAAVIGFSSELFIEKVSSLVLALLFLFFIIVLNIGFDIVGVAAMSASEVPFHAKAANKIQGSGQAVNVVRNADVVANFCADVVGDITGTITGALAAGIVLDILRLSPGLDAYEIFVSTFFLALVAAITVIGKAWGKTVGVTRANDIVFLVGRIFSWIEGATGVQLLKSGKQQKQRKRGKKT